MTKKQMKWMGIALLVLVLLFAYMLLGATKSEATFTPRWFPTWVPTFSPTPSASPSSTPEPTLAPSEEPQATEAPQELRVYFSIPEVPTCGSANTTKVAGNFHIYRKGDDAIAKWLPTEGNKVNLFYKENNATTWQYSLLGETNDGYVEVHGLGNLDITFALQQVNGDCSGGPLTQAVVDGPTKGWTLFR